jgi:hypothetical protein
MRSALLATRYLDAASDSIVLVEARHRDPFLEEVEARGLPPEEGDTVSGLNYARGDPIAVTLYRLHAVRRLRQISVPPLAVDPGAPTP